MACAAPGEVLGVPVQQLREDDAIGSLDLSCLDGYERRPLGVIGAELLGLMLPAATSLRELRWAARTPPFSTPSASTIALSVGNHHK